jgi:outer membrane protein W
MENLAFNKQDMLASYYGLEYESYFSRNLSFTIEGGYYEKTHYSQYSEYEYDDGTPIFQNLSLEILSLELDLKIYPIGHQRYFCPFIGAGVGIYHWKYEQWGEFINFDDDTVEEGYADTSTYTPGFNVKGGFTFRIRRSVGISFEAKYQYLKGELSSFFEGFDKLDLNGVLFNLGINFYL